MVDKKKTNEEEAALEEERDLKKENSEFYEQLTNKNQDYFFQLNSRLEDLEYDSEAQLVIINQMLRETVDAQAEAITARKMYGTVTESVNKILGLDPDNLEGESAVSPTKHLYLDGALLLGGGFSIINGISSWSGGTPPVSLLQLLMNFLLGGLVVLALLENRPDPKQNKGYFKYTLVSVAAVMGWVFAMTFIQVLPPSVLNPILPDFLVIGVGAAGLFARWYFKKKLNIRGTIF